MSGRFIKAGMGIEWGCFDVQLVKLLKAIPGQWFCAGPTKPVLRAWLVLSPEAQRFHIGWHLQANALPSTYREGNGSFKRHLTYPCGTSEEELPSPAQG